MTACMQHKRAEHRWLKFTAETESVVLNVLQYEEYVVNTAAKLGCLIRLKGFNTLNIFSKKKNPPSCHLFEILNNISELHNESSGFSL